MSNIVNRIVRWFKNELSVFEDTSKTCVLSDKDLPNKCGKAGGLFCDYPVCEKLNKHLKKKRDKNEL